MEKKLAAKFLQLRVGVRGGDQLAARTNRLCDAFTARLLSLF